jgi:hypothetical protein
MFGELDDLPFRDAPDLIQVEAPPALNILGLFRRVKERVGDHHDRCNGSTGHGENHFPIREQSFQLKISIAAMNCGVMCARAAAHRS